MIERLRQVDEEYETLEHQLADPEVLADPSKLRVRSKRYNDLGPVVAAEREYNARSGDVAAAREMLVDAAGVEREILVAEIESLNAGLADLEVELREMMLPTDPHDGKNVIVEIRGAEGGEESNLFARDLFEMYRSYATTQKVRQDMLDANQPDMGGFSTVMSLLQGTAVWAHSN